MNEYASTGVQHDFEVLLRVVAESPDGPITDDALAEAGEAALDAFCSGARGLALGPVVSVDLDEHVIEIALTIAASSAAELHRKVGQLLVVLEQSPELTFVGSTTERSTVEDDERHATLARA